MSPALWIDIFLAGAGGYFKMPPKHINLVDPYIYWEGIWGGGGLLVPKITDKLNAFSSLGHTGEFHRLDGLESWN